MAIQLNRAQISKKHRTQESLKPLHLLSSLLQSQQQQHSQHLKMESNKQEEDVIYACVQFSSWCLPATLRKPRTVQTGLQNSADPRQHGVAWTRLLRG